jgi:cytochrome c-type biogenesis protein CcmH
MTAFLLTAALMLALALAFVLPVLLRAGPDGPRRRPALAAGLALPLAAIFLYAMLGTPKALLPPPPATSIGPAQIDAMVNRLADRLKANPADADGWRKLARSYETLQRFDAAVDAYKHLLALEPDNADVLTDYAVTLAMSLNQSLSGEPERLIDRALAIDPNHVQALALSGSAAYERGEYAKAIGPWKKILAMVPANADIAQSISISVAKAEALAAASPSVQKPLRGK